MAMAMDQQKPTYKHYCRVCKKGFGCGPALGGHMRAHGINEEPMAGHANPADVDGPSTYGTSDGDADDGSNRGTKRMYALRANPIRLKSCRVCENCGEEFLSWKSFLEHGRCNSKEGNDVVADGDEYSSLASPPRSEADEDLVFQTAGAGWSKGKRSRRVKVCNGVGDIVAPPPRCPSSEEEDLANCLVMLSAACVEPMALVETEESCASASKEEAPRDMNTSVVVTEKRKAPMAPVLTLSKGLFECKACKKVFTSHQALGGHRASHKKVKGCFAAKLDELDSPLGDDEVTARNNASSSEAAAAAPAASPMAVSPFDNPPQMSSASLKKKSRLHECSICHRVFTSGQALGGHKRCHWITANVVPDPSLNLPPMPDHTNLHHHLSLAPLPTFENFDPGLDLNLPASAAADDLAVVPQGDVGSPLQLDVPAAAILLQRWFEQSGSMNNKTNDQIKVGSGNNDTDMGSKDKTSGGCNDKNVDEEVESKIKLAKLSELKEINLRGGETSPWLQVGIGSPANDI